MKSRTVLITRTSFYLLAGLWLAVGIGYIARSDGSTVFWIMAGLMFVGVFIFIALGRNITKKPVYWIGVAALAISSLLTIFDQFGIADLIALMLFLVPLVLMLVKRNDFLQETQ